MKRYIKASDIAKIAVTVMSAIICIFRGYAADPAAYAPTSILSGGKWVKIDISKPGLQTLTRQTLKNYGFNDPKAVHVYGYGGKMISEHLTSNHPDDLPAVPVVRKTDGSISFYAAGNISTGKSSSTVMTYDHVINPYSDKSCYFLSDVAPTATPATIDMSDITGLPVATSSTVQIVHERDLRQCATSGRDYLGEDFKTTRSQDFQFDLPDNSTGDARIRIKFGANTSGSSSSFIVNANGKRLSSTEADRIPACTSSEQYYAEATSVKLAEGVGNSLKIGIDYSPAGVLNMARLNWIEVEYERQLKLKDSQLTFPASRDVPTAYCISGVTEEAVVWDVTQPWAIKEVKGDYNAADKTLSIGVRDTELHEFIVFEPSATGASAAGRIKLANQDIHGLPTPDMVIITPDEYASAAERIANLHRTHDGMTVHVISPEKIYNEFSSGVPDVSAFRKLLKMWYDRSQAAEDGHRIGYCLLMGRPSYDQKNKNPETTKAAYPRTLIWQSATGLTESTSFCTDDFIAMLEDDPITLSMANRKQSIAVGRYPVTSAAEADAVADKLEAYMTEANYGIWRNNVMVIADDGDSANHLNQAENSVKWMKSTDAGAHYAYEKLYLDAFERKETGSGLTFPAASERMLTKWKKEGAALINYIGHANPKEWTHEKLLTWDDINNMQTQTLPILYAATCSFGRWDAEEISGAEILLQNPAGGAIAIITPSRSVYISQNGNITNSISNEFFMRDSSGNGQRIGDVVRNGKNRNATPDMNMLRYHLFGNPALRMPVARYNVTVDSIAGAPVADRQSDAPSLQAMSTVRISGRVTDSHGENADFNGPLQFTLFDAEKSVETHGWGDEGEVSIYQDRSSKLATGSTVVKDGKWATHILMPSEIANNYSPALLTLYAYDPKERLEANGATERLFVYGYDTASVKDEDGPTIEKFSIGALPSGSTGVVHSDPVVTAVFKDESGINISDAGIGHKMSLTLDNGKIYDDVCHYFIPDPEDATKGSISYPLHDLAPGEHELKLTVWDNAKNSSSSSLNFKVGVNLRPDLDQIYTLYDRAADRMTVKVITDRMLCTLGMKLECFDLNGILLWSSERKAYSDKESAVSHTWDITDNNGHRLNRGIYMLRTTVTTDDGLTTSKTKKIAIPAK